MFNYGLNSVAPATSKTGLLAGLKKINFANILNTTQKTLNVVNQAIPLVYQVKPIVSNAKTIFKIMGAVKNDNSNLKYNNPNTNSNNQITDNNKTKSNHAPIKKETLTQENIAYKSNINQPNFFI